MSSADEARFIELWQQGLETAAIARALGIPPGTARSRAYRLQQQGKIPPRPKGGKRVRQANLKNEGLRPVHDPVQSSAVHSGMHGAESVQNGADLPIPQPILEEVARLWAAIDALRQDLHRPVQNTVQSLPEPLFDDAADNATERWNLYLKHGLRVRIEALAQARGIAPSRVVQELLWHALHDR